MPIFENAADLIGILFWIMLTLAMGAAGLGIVMAAQASHKS